MFEVALDPRVGPYLKWVDRPKRSFERGLWVEIGHQREPGIQRLLEINRAIGLEVLIDENGTYRALVLKD
jgi:hypothetical protein